MREQRSRKRTRLLTTEWAPQCLISQGGGLLVSERGLACLVLLFSDKAVTKHFGCQPPAINASYCCNAEIFPAIEQSDKHHFLHRSGKPAMLQSGSAMFSKATAKIQVGNAASGLK